MIALLVGVVFGLVFPNLLSTWMIIGGLVAVIIVREIVGIWGFGNHWNQYRGAGHIIHSGVAASLCFGIFLGSGKIGTLLVMFGTLISR